MLANLESPLMSRGRILVLLWVLLFLLVSLPVRAQAPLATLLAGAQVEYRFDYRGDNTPIAIALDAPGATLVNLLVYTPGQIELMQKGQEVDPVGRGTKGRGHDLYWAGKFNSFGAYKVVVENRSPGPITYRLEITGESVSGVGQVVPATPPASSNLSSKQGLTVNLPPGAGASPLRIAVPVASDDPSLCLHANQVPPAITRSVRLCANEIYPPLRLVGNNIALESDAGRSAIINSAGRQFGLVIEGSYNFVHGVTVQGSADPADAGAFLCLYDECVFPTQPDPTRIAGGLVYGGGLLVQGSYNTIYGVTVRGGTIGVATVDGRSNYIVDNQLNDLNGWGSFNLRSSGSYFVGNTWNRENHACTTPDGTKFLHGCEAASWVCLACANNVIAQNHCELSGNCFYLSGERGLASNDNRFVANYCAGATDNCFEITFARGNLLQDNIATAEPKTGAPCKYPFWIGGSTVYFKNNVWQCTIGAEDALDQARQSTTVLTSALALTGAEAFPSPTPTRAVTATRAATPSLAPARVTPTATRAPVRGGECPVQVCETPDR